MDEMLVVEGVRKTFSHLVALKDISLTLGKGEILGLIGPNGSGKTTLINTVSGIFKPDNGKIIMEGKEITGMKPFELAHIGLNRTFQTPKPFNSMSVSENVRVALRYGNKNSRTKGSEQVELALTLSGLLGMENTLAASLNTFHKKMLDLSRAMVTGPKVLLVDELAAGLSTKEMNEVKKLLLDISDKGVSLIVVEHVMPFIKGLAKRVIVMNAGEKIFEGKFEKAADDDKVKEVYLGRRSVV